MENSKLFLGEIVTYAKLGDSDVKLYIGETKIYPLVDTYLQQ